MNKIEFKKSNFHTKLSNCITRVSNFTNLPLQRSPVSAVAVSDRGRTPRGPRTPPRGGACSSPGCGPLGSTSRCRSLQRWTWVGHAGALRWRQQPRDERGELISSCGHWLTCKRVNVSSHDIRRWQLSTVGNGSSYNISKWIWNNLKICFATKKLQPLHQFHI